MTSDFAETDRFSREQLQSLLRRWGIFVLMATAVASLTSFGVSRAIPPTYRATAQLYLTPAASPTAALQDVVTGQYLARSYVQLATADVVLESAMAQLGLDDLKSFRQHTQVAQLRDTSVITVTFRDGDPARAAQGANAIARAFIDKSRELQSALQGSTVAQLGDQIKSVQDDIKSLDAEIANLRTSLAASPKPGQTSAPGRTEDQLRLSQLDSARQAKQQTLAQLLKTQGDMRLGEARAENTVSLWQPANPPLEPESPRVLLNTAVGALLGLLAAFAVVAALGYLDDRIRDFEEVGARLGLPGLAQLHIGERPDSIVGKLFVREAPNSPAAEVFRSLRTNLLFANVDRRPATILVTSAMPSEGKSVISANLAIAFAESGPTVLLDADLRRPSQHRLFRISPARGLTSVLADSSGQLSLQSFAISPNLYVVPSGPLPPNPAELLSSSRMTQILAQIVRMLPDVTVIIDTSPVLAVADAAALATKVDGCVMVVDASRTRSHASRRAIQALRHVNGKLLGVVLNKVSAADSAYGYYYYYYSSGLPGSPRRDAGVTKRA